VRLLPTDWLRRFWFLGHAASIDRRVSTFSPQGPVTRGGFFHVLFLAGFDEPQVVKLFWIAESKLNALVDVGIPIVVLE
jgi:hypothetical protein